MYKVIIIFSLLFFFSVNCQNGNIFDPFDYEKDTPDWLKTKIDSLSVNPDYFGLKVYRYEYKGIYVYHIMIPISSCAYCELYNQDGEKISFKNDEEFHDFITKKRNKFMVWEWQTSP